MTGQDANNLVQDEDPKISEAKKKALIGYIQDKLQEVTNRQEEINQVLSSSNIVDPQASVEQVRKEIAELQKDIDSATKESQQLMSEIYEWNGKLSEAKTVAYNFSVLHKQYQSDIRRIGFIVDGASTIQPTKKKIRCPICGEETVRKYDTSFISASAAELEKIQKHLSELSLAQHDISIQQEKIRGKIQELEQKKSVVDLHISDLQEKLSSFETELEYQLNFIRLKSELDVIHKNEIQYKTELFQKETEEAVEPSKHNIFEDYSYDLIHGFEEKLKQIKPQDLDLNIDLEYLDIRKRNDKDYLNMTLSLLKDMEKNYAISLTEASNENLFAKYEEMFNVVKSLQREVFELAFRKGWYELEKAPSNKITEKYNTLNTEFNDLNN